MSDLHWNEEEQMYCDVNVNDEGEAVNVHGLSPPNTIVTTDESTHICHKGYLSLFPFLLSLLPPTSPHLGSILGLLHDPNHLWSAYGIRSLSASHPEFGKGENYWKGPIWVQMNYLALGALYKVNQWSIEQHASTNSFIQTYMKQEGPYQDKAKEIYQELRKNIVDNVVSVSCLWFPLSWCWPRCRSMSVPGMYGNNMIPPTVRANEGQPLTSFLHQSLICAYYLSHPFTGWTSLTALSEFGLCV